MASSKGRVVELRDQEVSADVLDACRRGDRDAFRLVYEAHKDTVYSMALYFFRGDAATAADVTQQVFLKVMEKMAQFRGQAGFATWLHRIVANTCIDRTRGRWRRLLAVETSVLEAHSVPPAQDEALDRQHRLRVVHAALATLTPKVRMAIVLRYFQDLSYEEMATALDCSVGTVASRLSTGHAKLGQVLASLDRKGGTS